MSAGQIVNSPHLAIRVGPAVRFHWQGIAWESRRPWQALAWGLVITLLQVALACLLSGESHFRDAYLRLFQWDGHWYGHIVENGYQTQAHMHFVKGFILKMTHRGELPFGNVAFFPAYPLLGRLLHSVLGLRTEYALVLGAQLGCWGFWTYLLLFFQRWRVSGRLAFFGVFTILIHPASFYLIASYSEPLYLMALLGFLYWAEEPRLGAGWLASLHGFVMTATRLVGLPLVIYPLCRAYLNGTLVGEGAGRRSYRRLVGYLLVAGVAALGSLAFFAFCQWRFGQWDLYMKTEEVGWQVHPNYWGLFSLKIFSVHWPKAGLFDPRFLDRVCVPVIVFLFVGMIALEWRLAQSLPDSGWRQRVGFYVCGALMFYVCVSGHYSRGMSSMTRFALCPHAMLVLAFVQLVSQVGLPARLASRRAVFWFVLWCLFSLAHQLGFAYQFTHGVWVA